MPTYSCDSHTILWKRYQRAAFHGQGCLDLHMSTSLFQALISDDQHQSHLEKVLNSLPSKITNDLGVASRRILQLYSGHEILNDKRKVTYHSSSSTLNVLALENMLSYAPILVRMASTGQRLETRKMLEEASAARL